MYKCPVPAGLCPSRRSVVFIIVTSAGLPEEPVPTRRSVLLEFTCLLDVRATLAITSRQRLADLVDEHRRKCACSAHAFFSFMTTRFGISENDTHLPSP